MKKSFYFLFLLLIGFGANAQITLSGSIKDQNKKVVPFATITIKGTYDGATSDSVGYYSFTTEETGRQILEISSIGFLPLEVPVLLGITDIKKDYFLKEKITELNAVSISAGAFEASDKKTGALLSSRDVVTTAGANGSTIGALNTLPGTQQVGESGGLFVRGGSANESNIYIDGLEVPNFFYASKPGIASRGRFNPFLFKGTLFSTGGYSAQYGQALSSALILESNDLADQTEAALNLSVLGIGGAYNKLNKKSSWGINYDYTNLKPIFSLLPTSINFSKMPSNNDGDFNFRIKTKKGMIKNYTYFGQSSSGVQTPGVNDSENTYNLKNLNFYANLTWDEQVSDNWKIKSGFSYTQNKDNISSQTTASGQTIEDNKINNHFNGFQLRVVGERYLNGLNTLRFGAEVFNKKYDNQYDIFTVYGNPEKVNQYTIDHIETVKAAFGELDYYFTSRLAFKGGLRFENSNYLKESNIAPRLTLAYKWSKSTQMSFAYGKYFQSPGISISPSKDPTNLGFSSADHYILQFLKQKEGRILRAELFDKEYKGLYLTQPKGFEYNIAQNNDGGGYARGLDIYYRDKKTIKLLDYWISYSYLDTKRSEGLINELIQPGFAAKHTASFVVKSFFTSIKTGFNASFTVASPRTSYFIQTQNTNSIIKSQQQLPAYRNLSFSLNYLPNLGLQNKKIFSVLVLQINNILNFKNIYGYQYADTGDQKVAVLPVTNQFIFLGWFINFGVDRTEDSINNNL